MQLSSLNHQLAKISCESFYIRNDAFSFKCMLHSALFLEKLYVQNHSHFTPMLTTYKIQIEISAFDNVEIEILANRDFWHTKRQTKWYDLKNYTFLSLVNIWNLHNINYLSYCVTTKVLTVKFWKMDRRTYFMIFMQGPN